MKLRERFTIISARPALLGIGDKLERPQQEICKEKGEIPRADKKWSPAYAPTAAGQAQAVPRLESLCHLQTPLDVGRGGRHFGKAYSKRQTEKQQFLKEGSLDALADGTALTPPGAAEQAQSKSQEGGWPCHLPRATVPAL